MYQSEDSQVHKIIIFEYKQFVRNDHTLKVHKRENFLGFDFEICSFS